MKVGTMIKCDRCGYSDNGTGDFAHVCGPVKIKLPELHEEHDRFEEHIAREILQEEDLVYRLRKRAEIRRQITSRKSVQEGKPDRIADLLEEAAMEIESLKKRNTLNNS